MHGLKETLECLIRNGSNINLKDSKGFTPLHYASLQDNFGAAQLLLAQKNIKIDVRQDIQAD